MLHGREVVDETGEPHMATPQGVFRPRRGVQGSTSKATRSQPFVGQWRNDGPEGSKPSEADRG